MSKFIVEVDSVGNLIDSHGAHVCMITLPHNLKPLEAEVASVEPVSLNKIIKLKEAGFDSDEILKMNAEGMI